MIDAGLPLVQGLGILAEQAENPTFKSILKQINRDVEGGSTLAEGMKKHPKVFDDLFVNLIAAGEVGGILDTILNRLAVYIEKRVKLKRQVRGALTYPITVFFIAIGVLGVMMVYVVPTFENMFADFGGAQTRCAQTMRAFSPVSAALLGHTTRPGDLIGVGNSLLI